MRILVLIIAASVMGCNSSSAATNAKPYAEQAQIDHSPGKPEHPLQVHLVTAESLRAGAESKAELVVSSAYRVESLEVELEPASGMMVSETRFARQNGALAERQAARFPLRLTSAVEGRQQVRAVVRATLSDGSVLTREITLNVDDRGKSSESPRRKGADVRVPERVPESADDVVMPAEQEIVRDRG